jgi:hypothetical protein
MTKLTASSLFFIPCQAQFGGKSFCDVYEGQAITVDQLLYHSIVAEGPKLPTYSPPVAPVTVPANIQGATLWDKMPVKAKGIFDSMGPGCRSHEATVLAGIAYKANLSLEERQALLTSMIVEKRIDKSAIRSVRQYMGLP